MARRKRKKGRKRGKEMKHFRWMIYVDMCKVSATVFVTIGFVQFNTIKLLETPEMQLRSKSAQQRKLDREHQQLQAKFNLILYENSLPFQHNPKDPTPTRQPKIHRFHQPQSRHAIKKVESVENVQLAKNNTAIGQLQQLVAPTSTEQPQHPKERRQANAESYLYEESEIREVTLGLKSGDLHILGRQNQTVEYYKQENDKLKHQILMEKQINGECMTTIKKLQQANTQLEKEISLLLHRHKVSQQTQPQQNRVKELESQLKQQVVINLELQEMLLRNKLRKEENEGRRQFDDKQYRKMIQQLRMELQERTEAKDCEIASLKQIISSKDEEIHKLKENKDTKQPEIPITLRDIESPYHPNTYLQRFVNFSKEMEARIAPQNFVSTNPSTQDFNQLTFADNIRKKSASVSTKGNCLSLAMPALEIKTTNRIASKTDRL